MFARRDKAADQRLATAEGLLGHSFADRDLLERALTHPSFSGERDDVSDYERLEFLGDSVLGLLVAEEIFARFPDMAEGEMTKIKVSVVNGSTLADVADNLGFEPLLRLGAGEVQTGGRGRASALENAFEATVGALYLDAGIETARAFVQRVLGPRIVPEAASLLEHPKSTLQELLQARGLNPEYEIISTVGPPHDRHFTARVVVGEVVMGEGSGHSKRDAEAAAALEALSRGGLD